MCLVCPTNDRVEQAPLELQVVTLFCVGVRAGQRAAELPFYKFARRLQRCLAILVVRRQIRRRRRRLRFRLGRGRLEELRCRSVDIAAGGA